jgi:hypothetical protein
LARAGFRLAGLEVPAVGDSGKVVIDALLFHEETNHLVQCESKSGANVEERQAQAYAAMSARAVVQAAALTLKHRVTPTLETLYVCSAGHTERIMFGLKAAGVSCPVLAADGRRIDLHGQDHASHRLRDALAGGVSLPAPPPVLVPFDQDSPVEEVEGRVLAALVAVLANQVAQVSLTGLTESAAPHYCMYAAKAQHKIKSLVGRAVARMVEAAPDRFAYDPPAGPRQEGAVRFLRTPEDLQRRGRTQAYQALSRIGKQTKARREPVIKGQLDLLRELDATDNGEEDPPTAVDDGEGRS